MNPICCFINNTASPATATVCMERVAQAVQRGGCPAGAGSRSAGQQLPGWKASGRQLCSSYASQARCSSCYILLTLRSVGQTERSSQRLDPSPVLHSHPGTLYMIPTPGCSVVHGQHPGWTWFPVGPASARPFQAEGENSTKYSKQCLCSQWASSWPQLPGKHSAQRRSHRLSLVSAQSRGAGHG